MPTVPRRWPLEVEHERMQILQETTDASLCLQRVKTMTDGVRDRFKNNVDLAALHLSDIDRFTSDTLASLERIQRHLAACRGKAIEGRWPKVANDLREQATRASQNATETLSHAQTTTGDVLKKLAKNPDLADAMLSDISRNQAKALVMVERVARLMTEAGIGRE